MRLLPMGALQEEGASSVFDGLFLELGVSVGTIFLVIVGLFGARKLLERLERSIAGHRFRGQIVMLALTLLGSVLVILTLPVGLERQRVLLNFFGILLTASIALASTTFLGNALAGLMLRSLRNYKVGDFLRCEGSFGRVTERGLFHTEIQTEDRDLMTLPNLYLATHPTTVVRASGTILSAAVSLGYDVPHDEVRELLRQAAERAGLSEPFVRIVALNDFTVEYRVGGLLAEVKELLSRRTQLRREMLDALHGGGVEIASPAILSTRAFTPTDRFVPLRRATPASPPGAGIEALAFDKADMAESVENLREEIEALAAERAELEKRQKEQLDRVVQRAIGDEVKRLALREKRLREVMARREAELDEERGP